MTEDELDAGRAWGGGPEMSAFESVMWRAQGDPRTRSTATLMQILDSEPAWNRLVDAHERVTRRIPRLRERVVRAPVPGIRPTWAADPHFDLSYHLHRVRLSDPGALRQLLDLAQTLYLRPLDPARPPWEGLLVEGLEGGRAAYLLKFHHSLADGVGLIQLLSLGHSTTAEPTGMDPAPEEAATVADGPVTPVALLSDRLRRDVLAAPSRTIRGAVGSAALAARVLRHPVGAVRESARFGASLRRVLTPPPTERSPALSGSGFSCRFEVLDVPLAGLRAAGQAAGGSVNDAYMAALLGGFRRYHDHLGLDVSEMPVATPISLRRPDDGEGGNRFGGARFAAPVGERDPVLRIRRVREFMLSARDEPAIGFMDLLAPVLDLLPTPLLVELVGGLVVTQDFQASNVPGLSHPVYLSGARVTRMYAFGPHPGCAAMFALLSYDGICCLGANLDPDAVSDPSRLAECLAEGFDEVLALGRNAPKTNGRQNT